MMTETVKILHRQLSKEFIFDGVQCRVIAVLEDLPGLVLEDLQQEQGVQQNQYGNAHRRAPTTYTIAVQSHLATELHPLYSVLLTEAEQQQLKKDLYPNPE